MVFPNCQPFIFDKIFRRKNIPILVIHISILTTAKELNGVAPNQTVPCPYVKLSLGIISYKNPLSCYR